MLRYSYSLFIFKANNEVARVNTTSLKITGNLRKTKKKRILNGTRAAVPSEWEINLFYRFHLCDSSVFIHSIANWKGTQLSCQLRLMQCRLDLAGDSIAAIRPFGFITKLHLCRHCEEFARTIQSTLRFGAAYSSLLRNASRNSPILNQRFVYYKQVLIRQSIRHSTCTEKLTFIIWPNLSSS